jgi:hypothetical protein
MSRFSYKNYTTIPENDVTPFRSVKIKFVREALKIGHYTHANCDYPLKEKPF